LGEFEGLEAQQLQGGAGKVTPNLAGLGNKGPLAPDPVFRDLPPNAMKEAMTQVEKMFPNMTKEMQQIKAKEILKSVPGDARRREINAKHQANFR